MRKETKAERIYKATRANCRHHIKLNGFKRNPNGKAIGFNSLFTDEVVTTRTLNAVQKFLDIDISNARLCLKYEVITEEEYKKDMELYEMVQATIDNAVESERKFKEFLAQ